MQVFIADGDFVDFVDTIQRVQARRTQHRRGASAPSTGAASGAVAEEGDDEDEEDDDATPANIHTHREADVRILVLTNFAKGKQISAGQLTGLLRLYRVGDPVFMDAFDTCEDQEELLEKLLSLL